jgi:hypothetical protein
VNDGEWALVNVAVAVVSVVVMGGVLLLAYRRAIRNMERSQ